MLGAVTGQYGAMRTTWEAWQELEKVSYQQESESRKRYFYPPHKLMMRITWDEYKSSFKEKKQNLVGRRK